VILGDHFPEALKKAKIQDQLIPGQVVYLHCDFAKPTPKNKYLLIASIEPQVLLYIINTSIHEYISSRDYLLVAQVEIDRDNHGFLDHNSYIDCTTTIRRFNYDELESILISDMSRLKGSVSADVRTQVLAATKASSTLPGREQDWILSSL